MRGDVGGTDGGGQTGYGSARYGRTAGMAGTSARWARGRKETRAAQRRTPPPPPFLGVVWWPRRAGYA